MPQAERPRCAAPGCPADAADASKICKEHQRKFRSRLAEVPGILADLQVTISRQDRFEQSEGHATETPLPFNDGAAIADQRLRAGLTMLGYDVAARADERDPFAPAVAQGSDEVSRWLIRNRHIVFDLPSAGEHWDLIDKLVVKARASTDRPAVRTRFHVGPCPQTQGEGDAYPGRPCPGECWALIPYEDDEMSRIACLTCHSRWDSTQWTRLGKRIRKRLDDLRFADPQVESGG